MPPAGAVSAGRRWWMHGLVVATDDDVMLDAQTASGGAPVDVTFRVGAERSVPAIGQDPDGRVLGFEQHDSGAQLTVVSQLAPDGDRELVVAHFHGYASATFDLGQRLVTLQFADAAHRGLAPVLFGGTVMALVLTLTGLPVLHASAVTADFGSAVGERSVAFVGRSGMGKSTVAALAVRDGAALLTDDVLRLDVAGDRVLAWPGSTAARLRPKAISLADEALGSASPTADGRTALTARHLARAAVPLAAVVIPSPQTGLHHVEVERLRGLDAFLGIAAFPRLVGWRDPATSGEHHALVGAVARVVPVLRAAVPWGPPFRPGIGAQILDAIRSELDHDRSSRAGNEAL